MRPSLFAPLTLLLVALGACAPDRSPPVEMVVLVYNPQARSYEPRRVKLHTLTDVVSMSGSAGTFIGGAEIVNNSDDPALQIAQQSGNVDKVVAALLRDEGSEVEVAYIETDGVLVPSDFHSLNIATSYYNLERTLDFLGKVGGLTPEAFGTPKVYYFPTYTEEHEEVKDNAAYVSLMQSLLILPFDALQQIPMAINMGIVGHELGHSLMNLLVHDRSRAPEVWRWSDTTVHLGPAPGANLLASLDEGYADLWGTGVTCSEDLTSCNTEFMSQSTSSSSGSERRVDRPHCMTYALRSVLNTFTAADFQGGGYQYPVGSVFASAVWAATEDAEAVRKLGASETRKQVYQALYRSLGGDGTSNPNTNVRDLVATALPDQTAFHLESRDGRRGVLDAVIDAAPDPAIKSALCSAFLDRFVLDASQIVTCPGTARSYAKCPRY